MNATMTSGDALVAVMLATSAADERLSDAELHSITRIVQSLPAFRDYEPERLRGVSGIVHELLDAEDGLDALIGIVQQSLTTDLHETAYALACDVAAADGKVPLAEMRWLQMLRNGLGIDLLVAAAIERGARARHRALPPA
ncbi:MAG: tellurite resistance TerB family protein [Ectothiorhodospiraceae bacterium]|nr:tellurite resistance TerB family protein [Ectothiorhodospiraceae bacterium]